MNPEDAVKDQIKKYMEKNGRATVPPAELAALGRRHGLEDAKRLNDIMHEVKDSLVAA
jgi:hypothetical protein